MKVVSVPQPWAQLCFIPTIDVQCSGSDRNSGSEPPFERCPETVPCPTHGGRPPAVKTIITGNRPAPKGLVGQRIAIASMTKVPGHYYVEAGPYAAREWAREMGGGWFLEGPGLPRLDDPYSHVTELPLGHIIGTAILTECLPVGHPLPGRTGVIKYHLHEGSLPHQQGGWWITGHNRATLGTPTKLTDQEPYCDFHLASWAYLLSDARLLPSPEPFKGGAPFAREWDCNGEAQLQHYRWWRSQQ